MRIPALRLCAAIAAAPLLSINAAPTETSSATITSAAALPSSATPATLADGAYELGGFFGAGDKLEVSLKKKGASESKWVRVGQKTGDLLVESADPKAGSAILNISGRRYRLNLRGEKATPLPVGNVTGSRVITASAPIAIQLNRPNETPEMKKKREKFESIMSGLTPEQHQYIGTTLGKRMREMMKNNPELAKGGDPKEMQRLTREAFRDGVREALQMPGKDGAAGSVPGDFNDLFEAGTGGDAPSAGAVVSSSVQVVAVGPEGGVEGGSDPAAAPAQGGAPQVQVLSVGVGSIGVTGGGAAAPTPAK